MLGIGFGRDEAPGKILDLQGQIIARIIHEY